MTQAASSPSAPDFLSDRLIGRHGGGSGGPLLICIGGLHGNEPAGVEALRRVHRRLTETRLPFRGRLVALAGNLTALSRGTRFVDEDLNRVWTLERISALEEALREGAPTPPELDSAEGEQQRQLLGAVRTVLETADRQEVYCLDLHTTSSRSVPFLTLSDSLRNRAFAMNFPVPIVLGLEEEVEGTLLDFLDHLGVAGVGVEGGNHGDPTSVDHLERAVWLALVSLGIVELTDVPEHDGLRRRLREATIGIPSLFEVRYRHGLRRGDGFRMEPGYENFQSVEAGELVARDRRGEIRSPESGRIFLPLYQQKGNEGFFLVREVAPVWLQISAVLRRLRLDAALRWLPAVRPHPEREESVVVHPRAAGPTLVNLFHLLGYRRERPENGHLVLTRRKDVAEEAGGSEPPEAGGVDHP